MSLYYAVTLVNVKAILHSAVIVKIIFHPHKCLASYTAVDRLEIRHAISNPKLDAQTRYVRVTDAASYKVIEFVIFSRCYYSSTGVSTWGVGNPWRCHVLRIEFNC